MTWVKKSKRISGNTVIDDSIAGQNLNCIDSNINLSSNSEFHVPSVEALKGYIATSGRQIVLEGFNPTPTNAYLVNLAAEKDIELQNGQEFLYVLLSLLTVEPIDSQIYTYSDESNFTVTKSNTTSDTSLNHFYHTNSRDNPLQQLNPQDFAIVKTSAFVEDRDAGTLTATNASTSDYAGFFNDVSLKVGREYKLEIIVSSTNNVGLKLDISSAEPDAVPFKTETIGDQGALQYNVFFTAQSTSLVFILFGKGGSNITISDLHLYQTETSRTKHRVRYPINGKYTVEILSSKNLGNAVFDTGDAVLLPSNDEPDQVSYVDLYLERSIEGYSNVNYRVTCTYNFNYVDQTAGTISVERTATYEDTLIIRND